LISTGQTVARRTSFARCGSTYYLCRSIKDPQKYKLAANACHDRFEEGRGNSTGPEHMTETNQLVECLHCPDAAECWEDKEQIFNLLRQNQYSQE